MLSNDQLTIESKKLIFKIRSESFIYFPNYNNDGEQAQLCLGSA